MKTVALITDAPYYLDRRAQRSVSVLRELDYQVVVLDQGINPEISQSLASDGIQICSSPIPDGGMKRFWWHVTNRLIPMKPYKSRSDWYIQHLDQINPGIVHIVNVFALEAVDDYCQRNKTSFVYEAYEYWQKYLYSNTYHLDKRLADYLVAVERRTVPHAKAVITVSPRIAEWYERDCGARSTAVIYNTAIEAADISPSLSAEAHKPLRFVHSGNLFKERNVDALLRAFALKENGCLTIQGRGGERPALESLVVALDLAERVSFCDPVPFSELNESLSHHDIGIIALMPHNEEIDAALPNKVFDYLAAGLGVVAFRTTALLELEGVDEFALLVEEPTIEALSSALNMLAGDPQKVLRMKEAAQKAARYYSPKQQRATLKKLYQSL